MSEKDFVIAWLLATRAGSGGAFDIKQCIFDAIEIWKDLEEKYETNS